MRITWRFYTDRQSKWRWQKISPSNVLISESPSGYDEYDECVLSAVADGYRFLPSQTKSIQRRMMFQR